MLGIPPWAPQHLLQQEALHQPCVHLFHVGLALGEPLQVVSHDRLPGRSGNRRGAAPAQRSLAQYADVFELVFELKPKCGAGRSLIVSRLHVKQVGAAEVASAFRVSALSVGRVV